MDFDIRLYPAIYLKSKIISVNVVGSGEYIAYGEYKVEENIIIGVCPIGYGDGVINKRKKYPVYIRGNYYNIVGDISMSHMYVKVDENIKAGDEVEIYGDNIVFSYSSNVLDTELMCSLKH